MPSLQKDGRVRLTGADQVAIILSKVRQPQTPTRSYSLPTHIKEFQRKHGGYFRYRYDTITFVVTNRQKFLRALRIKLRIAEKRKAIAEMKDNLRDVMNYEALLYAAITKGNKK